MTSPQLPTNPQHWLNTGGHALQLKRGTVYLLDFWTYCCINCLHILPDLAYLEEKYRDQPFVVVGVHSPKFSNEEKQENLQNALFRYHIVHPVLQDNDFAVWRGYGVRAWPTQILIDGKGYVVWQARGEGHRDALDTAIGDLLTAGNTPATTGLAHRHARNAHEMPLRFPGKVLADAPGNRLFIADTGHHRLVIAPLSGSPASAECVIIGNGTAGFVDGSFETTQFRAPQGMAFSPDGDTLFVADTENHAVRTVDLVARRVTTLAGTGKQSQGPIRPGAARSTDLNSPWDVVVSPDNADRLYLALAGSHQIALLTQGRVSVYAGNGREARVDGIIQEAAFAQPSGLAIDSKTLFVADSETSCVRTIDLETETVSTLAGSGDLFGWGEDDGQGENARFQHPLGIAFGAGRVFVADTYNHSVRSIDSLGQVTTISELGALREPGGVSVNGDYLYVADTNQHRVRRMRLSDKRWETVELPGLCAPGLCFPQQSSKIGEKP